MKVATIEGEDCAVNMEKVSRLMKRCRGGIRKSAVFGSELFKADKQFTRYLEVLLGSCDLEMEQDEDDPTYLTFLENLKEDKNSYILNVPFDHGMPFPLKYEDVDDSPDELRRKTPKSRSCILDSDLQSGVERFGSPKEDTLVEKRSSLHVDRELKSGVKDCGSRKTNTRMRSPKIVENLTNSGQKFPVSKRQEEVGCPSSQDHRSNSKAHLVNNSLRVFSSGLKVNRQSNVFEYGDGKRVYYEARDQQKSNNVQNKPSKMVPITKSQVSRSLNPTQTPSQPIRMVRAPAQTDARISRTPTAILHRYGSDTPSNRDSRTQIPTSRRVIICLRAPTSSSTPIPRIPTAKHGRGGSEKPSKRTSTTQIPTSRPTNPTPRAPISTPTRIPRILTAKDAQDGLDKPSKRASTTLEKERDAIRKSRALFCRRLEMSCREPYEKKEYEDLLEKVNARKPITVHKETRSRGYTKEGGMGKSYLDIYPDLHEEIKKVQSDPNKVLNLLRGFFLYLQYVPSGILPPWNINSLRTRTIMLGSTWRILIGVA